jgi:hypothetical protein
MRVRSSSIMSVAALALAIAGCSGPEPLGRFEMPIEDRVCNKDLDQVRRYIAQTPLPGENLRCNANNPSVEQCPCGTYCAGEFCTAKCVTVDDPDRGCEPDEICSNLGECYLPGAPLPTEILSLAASPGYAEVVTPTGSNNFAETVVQLVMTGDSTPPDPPRIFVRGATTTKVTCPGGAADCANPTQTLVNELEVACGTGASYSTQCSVDDWAFESTSDGVRAVREVRVRPRKSATAAVWELDITAGDHTAPQTVSLVRKSAAPRPLEGMYTGRLVLSRGGAPEVVADLPEPDPDAPPSSAGANLSLPITAVIKNNQVVLIDPARILSESGKLRLKAPGTYGPVHWLSGDDGFLRGRVRSVSREHDAARGHVRQRFTVVLPTEEPNFLTVPATLFGLADLDWRGPIDAPACAAGCAVGTSCDSSVQLCLPGPAIGSDNVGAGSSLGFAALWDWTGAVEPQLQALGIQPLGKVTPDSYERLQCYRASGWDPQTSPQSALLTGNPLARTGDLRCGAAGGSLPMGVPLRNRIDASGGLSATESVSGMMGFCRDELAAAVPSGTVVLPEGKCLSPARVLPAIGMAVSRGTRDTRGVLLLQHLVRSWVGAAGFTAQQGIEQVTLGDADSSVPDVDSLALLAASQRLWQLVTDSSVAHTLVTLPPGDLADPDYRGSNRPVMYWPGTGKADVEGAFPLSSQRDCVQRDRCGMDAVLVDPRQLDLSGDLSAAFEVDSVRTAAYQDRLVDSAWLDEHPLIESPWLTVVETVEYEIRDIHFTRTGRTSAPHGQRLRAPSWNACRNYCIDPTGHITVPTCRSWSFQPLGPGDGWCNLSSDLDGRVAQANTRSGVLTRGPRAAGPIAVPDFARDTMRVSGVKSVTQHVPDAGACYDLCYDDLTCTAINYFWNARTCHQLTDSNVFETYVGALTVRLPNQALRVGHTTTRNRPVMVSFPVRGTAAKSHILVSRNSNRYARHDQFGGSTADTPYSALVRGGGPARLWVGRRDGRTAAHVAIWDTALDTHEYAALRGRVAANQANYAARTAIALPEPAGVKNRDQGTELAVTLVEALVPQLRLLQSYLESVQGSLYESCVSGGSSTLAEEARGRAGLVLRTALYVQGLARRMQDRARQLACTADAQCPTGATCGIGFRVALDGLIATTTGLMQQCTGVDGGGDVVGICVPASGNPYSNGGLGGNGSATPGQVGTATFTFTVATAGSRVLWARTAARPHAVSFWFRVDGGEWQLWYPDHATSHDWAWSSFGDAAGSATLIPLTAGSHTITISVHDDGLVLRELAISTDAIHPPDDIDDVCYLDGAPIVTPAETPERVARDEVWRTAQSELDGAMQALLVKSAAMGECRNPLGIEETDLPLYFSPYTDESTPAVALYFAASLNLYDKASKAIGAALTAYQAVDVEWRDLQHAKFQSETLDAANDSRMSAIAGRYSDELEELCGSSSSHDGGLLGEFIDGDRQADTCFVEITKPGCLANLEQPISEASAACYRGTVGQALLGMKTANYAISTASMSWESKQDQYEAQAAACAHLQETASIIKAHQDHMAELRRKKGLFDKISAGVSLAAGVATGTSAAALAVSLFGNVGEQIGGENGPVVGWSDGLGPTGQVLGIASGAVNLSSMFSSASEIGAEQAAFQVQMQARANELEIMQCFAVADRLRDEIEISAVTIKQAVTDFEQATMAFGNRRARIGQLVAEGRAEVAREDERSLALPYHEFRLDRRIQVYQRKLAHAKRLTYLFLRAAEYDKQASFPYRAVVLDARNIEQLEAAFDDIAGELNDGRIGPNGAIPQARSRVVSLLELMGLPDSDAEALSRHLRSPASFVYGTDGQLLGRGVRFQLTPTSPVFVGSSVPDSCAEHVTGVTGSVQLTGGNNEEELAFKLAQRNVFASQQCNDGTGDPVLVTASHWPARNLFDERPTSLVETAPTTPSTIDTFANLTRTQLKTTPPRLVTDFMGRGLFGEYVLYFDKDLFAAGSAIDMSRITNVLLRLDWTSGENGAAPE